MRRVTLPLLVVLVAGLALLWRTREQGLEGGAGDVRDHLLWPDLAVERVLSVRIDNLERAAEVKLERDRRGSWFLTDPIAYPAQDELVHTLLTALARGRGVLEPDADPAALSLEPPLAVVEVMEAVDSDRTPGTDEDISTRRRRRIEIGAVDVDASRVHVRVPGHPAGDGEPAIFLASRTLYTTVDRNPDDYRDPRTTPLRGREVVELRRSGSLALDGDEPTDLTLTAAVEGDTWMRTDGARVALDPSAIGVLARCAAELRANGFLDDAPRDLAPYGLAPPTLRVELIDERGERVALRFGYPERYADVPFRRIRWTATREGFDHVWEVDGEDVRLLLRPAADLVDHQIVRVQRDDVARVVLERAEETLFLERDEAGWTVRTSGAAAGPLQFPADDGAVEDLLTVFERAQVGQFLPGVGLADGEAEGGGGRLAFTLETRAGKRLGGELGGRWRDAASGARGHLFRRLGDELVGQVGDELAEACRTPLAGLRSRLVHRYAERDVTAVRFEHADRPLDYVRLEAQWYPYGVRIPAPVEVPLLIERLIALRAEAWLEAAPEPEALASPVRVVLKGRFGETLFLLGKTADGGVVCRTDAGQAARVAAELLDDALALFGP